MGRKIGKKASKRMKQLREASMKGRFACHYLTRKQRKAITNWKAAQKEPTQ